MMDKGEWLRSVESIWLVWLGCSSILATLLITALRRLRGERLRQFLHDESGAGYALPYVMTFPVYLLLVCLVIQSTIIIMVKTGTIYAAYAAARAAAVWRIVPPDTPPADRDAIGLQRAQQHAHRAAVLAMTPLASSYPRHLELFNSPALFPELFQGDISNDPATDELASQYTNAYGRVDGDNIEQDSVPAGAMPGFLRPYRDQTAPAEYLTAKVRYARQATDVTLRMADNPWDPRRKDVSVTVNYVLPLHIPLAGAILRDGWQGWAAPPVYWRTITSSVRLPAELPLNADQSLGIRYDPDVPQ